MSKKDPLACQLEECIAQVVLPLEETGRDVSVVEVANSVDALIDPDCSAPPLKTYASTMRIREQVRKHLARRHDPVQRAEDYAEGQGDDLFNGTLQAYYPAKRQTDEGSKSPVYVPIERLTEVDVAAVCGRMEKAGASLVKHADALKAWFYSRNAA